jgi:hypothetical protein
MKRTPEVGNAYRRTSPRRSQKRTVWSIAAKVMNLMKVMNLAKVANNTDARA